MKQSVVNQSFFLPGRAERITDVIQRYVNDGKISGMVGLVARHGEIVYFNKTGYQNLERKTPMRLDSIFQIFSMTKPITSVALMMLYEQGLVRLNDPVAKFIPEFKRIRVLEADGHLEPIHTDITVQMLLTHTSGLSYGEFDSPSVAKYYQGQNLLDPGQTLGETIRRITELPQAFQPGEKWHYSLSSDVAGHLVELISGMPLKDYFTEMIFSPLGMQDTSYTLDAHQQERRASLYGPAGDALLTPLEFMPTGTVEVKLHCGGHGLYSTAQDYFMFCQMILNKGEWNGVRLLAPRTVDFMCQNHLRSDQLPIESSGLPRYGMGFGLGFGRVLEPALACTLSSPGTCGWGGAAGTDFWIDFQEDLVGILMLQIMPGDKYPVAGDFRTAVYQALTI